MATVESLFTTGFGYLTIGLVSLYRISPAVAAAPVLILAILIHFLIQWSAAVANRQMQHHVKSLQGPAQVVPASAVKNSDGSDSESDA